MKQAVLTVAAALAACGLAAAQSGGTLAQRTSGLERHDGFIPFYFDAAHGRVLFEVPKLDEDVLYYVSYATSPGSVEIGMDRGITRSAVIRFERPGGPRVLVIQRNLKFRAPEGPGELAQNVEDSFAQSVLAALPIEAEEGGRLLVDATPLFMRDAPGLEANLRRLNEGTFRFDAARSTFYTARMKAFPKNTEVEITATYAGDNAGFGLRNVSPDPQALTLRIHHSFLQAPTGYHPRPADSRIGVNSIAFKDFGAPFDRATDVRWVERWRLEKKDPAAAVSEPKTPLVYYLDPAIPEPARSAVRRGVLWWNTAFEAAGFKNAVQVKDPTPDMDPMDIRYAWLLWINRDERGFSSSGSYVDPRTGEVLGAKVHLDSNRIRTMGDYWSAYEPTDGNDDGAIDLMPEDGLLTDLQAAGVAINRGEQNLMLMRQSLLAAHEVGHGLGLEHNWNASINDRSSVMEYPTPRVKVTAGGRLDVSDAFQTSVGTYDVLGIRYAYTEFAPGAERDGLEGIVREMRQKQILFTPQTDPRWSWYDDLASPTDYLRDTMKARTVMLAHYGPEILRTGEPIGDLRDMRLWMVYLHHRWAIDAAVKYVGGMYHNLVVKGENIPPTEIVPAPLQREVVDLLMQAVQPASLTIPERLLAVLTPPPHPDIEDMADGYAFDQLRAARILSAMVIEQLLQPDRAARLVAFADRQPNALTLPELVDAILKNTWGAPRDGEPSARSLRRVSERVALDALMALGGSPQVTPEARAVVLTRLDKLRGELTARHDDDPVTEAHIRQAERDIARYLQNPAANAPKTVLPNWGGRPRSRFPLPPGPPLGG
ncbi:MAG TPA: zinc-dependent metalloprotease [Vicinamibacterales bacterium]|nr:zinc-dependent metalloprotease [Vicinamibacterales bacterium]